MVSKKTSLAFLATMVILVWSISPSQAQILVNGDFETGDFTGWNTLSTAVIETPGSDPAVTDITLPKVIQGQYSARIGDGDTNCLPDPLWRSSIWQTVTIPPPPNSFLSFWYAVVAEGSHTNPEASGFVLTVTAGTTVVHQIVNNAYDDPSPAPGWTWQANGIAYYNWTQVAVDLSAYAGQQLIVNFTVHDCTLTGHVAWGYLDGILVGPSPTPTLNPVGGVTVPVNKLSLLAPWIGLAALVTAAMSIIVVKRRL